MATTVDSLLVAFDNQVSAGAAAAAASLDKFTAASKAAEGAASTTDTTVTRSTRSWQSWAASGVDPASQAAAKIEKAQRDAAAATDALNKRMAEGGVTATSYAQQLANIGAKLDQAAQAAVSSAAKTQASRDATAAASQSMAAWSVALSQGSSAWQTYLQQVQAGSTATRSAAEAAAAATQAQSAFNTALGVRGTDTGMKSAADSASAFADAIDQLRGKWVPLAAAQQRSAADQQEINDAFRTGVLTSNEAAAALDRVVTSYQKSAQAASDAAAAARQATAAQGQSIANSFAGVQTANVVTDPTNYAKRASDLEAAFEAAARLRGELVPLAAAEQAYAAQIAKVASAEAAGVVTAQEAVAARTTAQASLKKQVDALNEMGVSSGAAAASTRNLTKGQEPERDQCRT